MIASVLTPAERYEAMRQLRANAVAQRWFITISVVAVIALAVLLFVVTVIRAAKQRKTVERVFAQQGRKMGMSEYENRIMAEIAKYAGLKQPEAIFNLRDFFDRGAKRFINNVLAQKGIKESRRTSAEISLLRRKLGFIKQYPNRMISAGGSKQLSSRQIGVGKKLYLTCRSRPDLRDIEGDVIQNNELELTVKLPVSPESVTGELWCGHYYFGASVWEFDTSVISSQDNCMVLNHSDEIRFINRRRFLRVPVTRAGYIARFPFTKVVSEGGKKTIVTNTLKPPEFVPAVITELGGPGLRTETKLKAKVGDRVLVVFNLDDEKQTEYETQATPRVIEDIGEVKSVRAIKNGLSVAIELTGLNDSNVSQLIQATNAASIKTATAKKQAQELMAI